MIRLRVKKYLDEKSVRENKRITLNDLSEMTKISRATLNRIVNKPNFKTNTDAINRLCFHLDCTPCELIDYTPGLDEDDDKNATQEEKPENESK